MNLKQKVKDWFDVYGRLVDAELKLQLASELLQQSNTTISRMSADLAKYKCMADAEKYKKDSLTHACDVKIEKLNYQIQRLKTELEFMNVDP